ncbi:MAG TPA: hypothetical protein VIY96_05655 [Thermoanaerobaculia bacterium]
MKKSFVRVISLVGVLALPVGLVAQANPSKSATTEKSTTKMETKTTDKGTKKVSTKKSRRHHKKATKTQAAKPTVKK